MNKKTVENYLSILGLICIVLISALYVFFTLPHKKRSQFKSDKTLVDHHGQDLLNFTLSDKNGKNFHAQTLKGKPTLIYFGFTFCPDICPISLTKLASVTQVLKRYGIDFNAVFITVDPARDTPEVLNKYIDYFSPEIIALTGNDASIAQVAALFNVYYARDDASDKENYMLNHSSFIYVLDENGRLCKVFSFSEEARDIIEFFRAKFR